MNDSLSRRGFLATLPLVSALAQTAALKITSVEIWELRGHRDAVRGVDQQHQVNPLDIYESCGRSLIATRRILFPQNRPLRPSI